MQFIVALLKKIPILPVALFIAGLVLGLLWGYVIDPVDFKDATPSYLRADLQEDYLRMAIDSYLVNQNPNLAVERWKGLGVSAQQAFTNIQNNPNGISPIVIKSYGDLVTSVLTAESAQPSDETAQTSSLGRTALIAIGLLVVLGVIAASGMYLFRLLGKRGSGEVTAAMQASEINRSAARTNFEELGLATPITQTMTTYVLGDDLYDESFSIDTQAGEFMGEYGVGVAEIIGVGDPKKVTALEIWLFDKNDIKTATKVLMSQHAFSDLGIRSRLEPKGELVVVEPRSQVLLETATLQLLATVSDLEYGKGPLPDGSYFERITLELAVWPRQG
ncbi:MAG TPA: hypothetical protein PKL78_15265 [Anaerolineales bacterium]|nr:hypothetical protein [Anaerolineales bacterium]HNN14920.1 hypothetical protein [Anaerolineales bacterium]